MKREKLRQYVEKGTDLYVGELTRLFAGKARNLQDIAGGLELTMGPFVRYEFGDGQHEVRSIDEETVTLYDTTLHAVKRQTGKDSITRKPRSHGKFIQWLIDRGQLEMGALKKYVDGVQQLMGHALFHPDDYDLYFKGLG